MGVKPFTVSAQVAESYGQFIVLNALTWLPTYLEFEELSLRADGKGETEHAQAIRALKDASEKVLQMSVSEKLETGADGQHFVIHAFKPHSIVNFELESSGKFHLPGHPTSRAAVTGDAIDSRVIFNLDRIGDPAVFGFEQALRLWVHELGHKIGFDKDLVDRIGAGIARYYGVQAQLQERFVLINGMPFHNPGLRMFSPVEGMGFVRAWNRIGWIENGRLKDITETFNSELNRFRRPLANHREINRTVLSVKKVNGKFVAEIMIFRTPVNDQQYLITDMGGPHRFSAEFEIVNGEPVVLSYREIRTFANMVPDAEIKIESLARSGTAIEGWLDLTVFTEKYFHYGSYPVHSHARLVLQSGERTVEIPLEIHADMKSRGWGAMPGDIFKKEAHKRGRFTGELPADWPDEFEVIGMVDEFYGMGHRATGTTTPMVIPMREPFRVTCESALLPLKGSN